MLGFYCPNGRRSWFSISIPLAAAAASGLLAPAYAAASLYMPNVFANLPLLACYGALTGLAAGAAARFTRTLNPQLAGFLAVLGGLAGFLLSWSAWVSLVDRFGGADFPGADRVADFLSIPQFWIWIFERPLEFFERARAINGSGTWGLWFLSGPVKGIPLLLVWVAECLIFFWLAAEIAARAAWAPYSFEAEAYLRGEPRLRRGVAAPADVMQLARVMTGLASGDLTYLHVSPVAGQGEPGFYVKFSSHERSPWGTADVTFCERKGGRSTSSRVTRGAIVQNEAMRSLKARLA
ncbi:MAG: hypothetical protein LBQ79_00300 [Deltaproteobacteria bacterium]|jgi:hypothetical protein|nr:hypothetical protein [Deltaproteobacteria bacterium]